MKRKGLVPRERGGGEEITKRSLTAGEMVQEASTKFPEVTYIRACGSKIEVPAESNGVRVVQDGKGVEEGKTRRNPHYLVLVGKNRRVVRRKKGLGERKGYLPNVIETRNEENHHAVKEQEKRDERGLVQRAKKVGLGETSVHMAKS